jgi:8-oxo-dGTP diphosphatase
MVRMRCDTNSGGFVSSDLERFPRPSVAVDVAVLSVVPSGDGELRLCVLCIRRDTGTFQGEWSLPGSFLRERERLDGAVQRTLRDKCGVEGLRPTQLVVLDAPDRDDRGWVLSVAHLDTVPTGRAVELLQRTDVRWLPVRAEASARRSVLELPAGQRWLPFDHEEIVRHAVDRLRSTYEERPDPHGLLDEPFTVRELRRLHEAVLGEPLQKDTFRRAMLPGLVQTRSVETGSVGRPARRYRRR